MFRRLRLWRRARRYRAGLAQLMHLSPAELKDLGIASSEIERLARAAFWNSSEDS